MGLLSENRIAIRFLIVFLSLYIALNTLYGLYTESFLPQADPITSFVSNQVSWILSRFDETIKTSIVQGSRNINISNAGGNVISVFEGCNGVNVMIVFLCFTIAFRGPVIFTIWFGMAGIVVIYMINLARVSLLYLVEIYFSQYLYFFHKYLFTGLIYMIVFIMWYVWVKRVSRESN